MHAELFDSTCVVLWSRPTVVKTYCLHVKHINAGLCSGGNTMW
jgi:hypothetical protein